MIKRLFVPALIVLGSILGAVTLFATGPQLQPMVAEPVPMTVRVLEVVPESVQMVVRSQGTVTPSTVSELIPEVSGRVAWMSPALVNGGSFAAGEVLLRLEDQDHRSAVERAAAALARAEAEQQHARFEFERMESLEVRQLVSRSVMENALRAARVADAALRETEAQLAQAERDLTRTEIRAPFAGLVARAAVDIGQFVSRGNAIASLYAGDVAEVRLPIADRQLAFLNLPLGIRGELPLELQPAVTLRAEFGGQQLTWEGRLVRTEAQIDTSSRMVHAVARVVNAPGNPPLSVGLYVSADIQGSRVDDVFVLPRSALREGNRILVLDAEDRLRFRDIEPLRLHENQVLIRDGLSTGERVCVSPLQTAVEGMPVRPLIEAEPAGQVTG